MKLLINGNIISYNDKSIVMKSKIIDYIITTEYIVILEEYVGDDFDLVYCFDTELNLLWEIKTPDSKFIGKKQLPYVGLSIGDGLTVVDTLGRYFIIDIDTGDITNMFCNRF